MDEHWDDNAAFICEKLADLLMQLALNPALGPEEAVLSLEALGSQVLAKIGEGVVQLGAAIGDKASLVAFCSPAAVQAGHQAGKIVGELSAQLGGKGGGKPDFAMGGGKEPAKLAAVLQA